MTINRRSFLKSGLAAGFTTLLPAKWVFAQNLASDIAPLDISALTWKNAEQLADHFTVINTNPVNAYPGEHMLNDAITPANKSFIRWNGLLPDFEAINPKQWLFSVGGESVVNKKSYNIEELKNKFKQHTLQLTIECGGNSRSGFYPATKGNQWNNAGVFCSNWTGVLLKDVLNDCGIKPDAVYTGHHSLDKHLSGKGEAISRGVPIQAALDDQALIAWAMNGEEIPYMHGYPLRLVFGGRPGSVSQKCVTGVSVRNKVHDGPKMAAPAYQVPSYPIAPGEKVNDEDFKVIEQMIVKSLISYPKSGTQFKLGDSTQVSGQAWAGMHEVAKVEVSYDYGKRWQVAKLTKAANTTAWQQWHIDLELPQHGYYEIWAKATDDQGNSQPVVQPQWNPKGYLFNGCHRIAVRVT